MIRDLDLRTIFKVIKRSMWCCIAAAVLFVNIVLNMYEIGLIKPKYEADVSLYVTNESESVGVNVNDITASQKLASTYVALLEQGNFYQNLHVALGLQYELEDLKEMVSLSVVEDTEVIRFTAEAYSLDEAMDICDAFINIAPDELSKINIGGSVEIVGDPRANEEPILPSVILVCGVAAIVGYVLVLGIFVVVKMFDTKITGVEEVVERYRTVEIGSIPDIYEAYHRTVRAIKKNKYERAMVSDIVCDSTKLTEKTPFIVNEAYHKAAVNIKFATADKERKIILVTSAMPHEYKSTTSSNLAIAFAQSDAKTLLIDADLRKPTADRIFELENEAGLSNVALSVQETLDSIKFDVVPNLDVLTGGEVQANPSVVLNSENIGAFLDAVIDSYDYIIIDSPPLVPVSDAVLLSRHATGVVLVVKQNSSRFPAVDAAIKSLNIAKVNLLGILMTGTEPPETKYRGYGYGYGYGYGRSESGDTAGANK